MIRNIVFDMGGVLLHFSPDRFIELLGVNEEDKALLLREVFRTVEWCRLDRGTIEEEEAAAAMKRNLPLRLHGAAVILFLERKSIKKNFKFEPKLIAIP